MRLRRKSTDAKTRRDTGLFFNLLICGLVYFYCVCLAVCVDLARED